MPTAIGLPHSSIGTRRQTVLGTRTVCTIGVRFSTIRGADRLILGHHAANLHRHLLAAFLADHACGCDRNGANLLFGHHAADLHGDLVLDALDDLAADRLRDFLHNFLGHHATDLHRHFLHDLFIDISLDLNRHLLCYNLLNVVGMRHLLRHDIGLPDFGNFVPRRALLRNPSQPAALMNSLAGEWIDRAATGQPGQPVVDRPGLTNGDVLEATLIDIVRGVRDDRLEDRVVSFLLGTFGDKLTDDMSLFALGSFINRLVHGVSHPRSTVSKTSRMRS